MVFGIVSAAGTGRRMGGEAPKLEVEVLGKPLLFYTLEAFQQAASIDHIILTVQPERLAAWSTTRLQQEGFEKIYASVAGGATRQESVNLALGEVTNSRGVVVIHDGARPLVTADMIDRVSAIPEGADGVITVVGLTDTVKEVRGDKVVDTLDRERLVAVQTPQAFPLEVLRKAHRRALKDGFRGTDDASLVERIGGVVRVIEGSRENIKVTFPEDIERVKAILIARGNR